MDFYHLHHFSNFSASSEAFFKIPDATCWKIGTLSIFGALIGWIIAPTSRHYRGTIFPHESTIWPPGDPGPDRRPLAVGLYFLMSRRIQLSEPPSLWARPCDLLHTGMSRYLVHCNISNEKLNISTTRLEHFVFAARSSPPASLGRRPITVWSFKGLAQF